MSSNPIIVLEEHYVDGDNDYILLSEAAAPDSSSSGAPGGDAPGGGASDEPGKKEKDIEDSKSSNFNKERSTIGYYFNYTLKISNNDKDHNNTSNQFSFWRSLLNKILDTEIEFRFTGLGTGNTEVVSLKKIIDGTRKMLHDAFGGVDPEVVLRNIRTRFEKTYPSFNTRVQIRDR